LRTFGIEFSAKVNWNLVNKDIKVWLFLQIENYLLVIFDF